MTESIANCHFCGLELPRKDILEHLRNTHPIDYARVMKTVNDYKKMEEEYPIP